MGPLEIIILLGLVWYLRGYFSRRAQRSATVAHAESAHDLKLGLVIGSIFLFALVTGAFLGVRESRSVAPPPVVVTYGESLAGIRQVSTGPLPQPETVFTTERLPIRGWSMGLFIAFAAAGGFAAIRSLSSTRIPLSDGSPQSGNGQRQNFGVLLAKGVVAVGLIATGWYLFAPHANFSSPHESSPSILGDVADSNRAEPVLAMSFQPDYPVWTILIAGVAFAAFLFWLLKAPNSIAQSSALPNAGQELGWGWLIIPTMCFAALLAKAIVIFNPVPQTQLVGFPQRHEKMLKSLKEFVELHTNEKGGISESHTWLSDAMSKGTDGEHIVLVSGLFSTAQETEDELLPIVADLIQQSFHKTHPWRGHWQVPLALVRERAIEKQYIDIQPKTISKFSGDLFQRYMLVNLSPDVLRTFEGNWKAVIVERRLIGVGVILGWFVCHLLIGMAYFQSQGLDPQPGRWRWKLAATVCSIGVTIAAGYGFEWLANLN